MTFNRTPLGQAAKYRFHAEPLVWVEGKLDASFYQMMLDGIPCRVEIAGGKAECLKLAYELDKENHPFVVILDGDYDMLKRRQRLHKRVLVLARYSIENYLFEKDAFERICCNYAPNAKGNHFISDRFDSIVKQIETELLELLVLDIAHSLAGTGILVLPPTASRLLRSGKGIWFSTERISETINKCSNVEANFVDCARALVEEYTQTHRLVDLVKGHFLFDILRTLIFKTVDESNAPKPTFDNTTLTMLLSAEIWRLPPTREHKELKKRLRRIVRQAARDRALQSVS